MGLDYGEKTIGVSVANLDNRVAVGITTITRQNPEALRPSLQQLKALIRQHCITDIVLGYPLNMDGSESVRCAATLEFRDKLARYFKSKTVHLWDERLSTLAVSRVFEGKRENFKKHVDEMAAVYILQGFLDAKVA